MRSGYQMRKWQAAEARDDKILDCCGHRNGGHRGTGEDFHCIGDSGTCACSEEAWRRAETRR